MHRGPIENSLFEDDDGSASPDGAPEAAASNLLTGHRPGSAEIVRSGDAAPARPGTARRKKALPGSRPKPQAHCPAGRTPSKYFRLAAFELRVLRACRLPGSNVQLMAAISC